MPDPPTFERIVRELEEIRSSGLWRSPVSVRVDLSINSYLSLQSNREVEAAALELAGGRLYGNLASRLVGSQSSLYERLEQLIAAWKNTESALVFGSGYAANVGVMSALCGRGTDVFSDRLNHASIIDGIRLGGANHIRYRHCDIEDLRERLASSSAGEKVIVTETVFSMDGDVAPLAELCDLAERYGCLLVIDEAHASGVFGLRRAGGVAEDVGCERRVAVHVGTLSKAVAGAGGFFAGPARIRDYLVNRARSLIFSTGLPHAVLAWDVAAVEYIMKHPEMGRDLRGRSARFRDRLREVGFDTGASASQIIPLMIGGNDDVVALSRRLLERGIKVPAVRSPAVPRGTERLRMSIHAGFGPEQEDLVLGALGEWRGTA